MNLSSPAFENSSDIPVKYTCDGENVSPPLLVSDIPEGAESLVLIMDDPDATSGRTFDHWIVFNISDEIEEIQEYSVPEGALQGRNDFGRNEYGGPCPPAGAKKHRYMFKLYALDGYLDLPSGIDKKTLEQTMEPRVLDQATLVGLYGRK
ncbi:MAG: YbhB/YbcL family Raf kinase inhibitor-like protein [Candidatus Pacebacteria bacterium]|nr:YbhB/YbcL family Raf kinase inhibitor-like protein [Candidatus Paceibacterota bacterium]